MHFQKEETQNHASMDQIKARGNQTATGRLKEIPKGRKHTHFPHTFSSTISQFSPIFPTVNIQSYNARKPLQHHSHSKPRGGDAPHGVVGRVFVLGTGRGVNNSEGPVHGHTSLPRPHDGLHLRAQPGHQFSAKFLWVPSHGSVFR